MAEQLLFTLNVPTNIKDEVVDALISLDCISGFNLKKIEGYSKAHSEYDIAEQVEGYRSLYQLEVHILVTQLQTIKTALTPVFKYIKLKYWVTPVIESGHLGLNMDFK
ncbi:DUF3240 family protein [Pseudoalteromonas sp. H105]|uniref:DUF3240 family protein n=1 Tax=Pseudoalteromonas sp. H105 TaxID=1348393 RepID=UPI0007322213|nr:DUF3240 family protein [Pseudoalteromonas sp. H105]KTF18364.1 hypothetical protein ATS75_02845 [Pseudoalteromonas sp. H105]